MFKSKNRELSKTDRGPEMKALSKHDRGAIIFQGWFNRLRENYENLEGKQLTVTRSTVEMKKRLDVLEETVKLLSAVVFEEEPKVWLTCISCDHSFTLSLPEATAQNFTSLCEVCHAWALPFPEGREFTLREISELTGFGYTTTVRAARKLGVKLGQQDKRFTKTQFEKIRAVLDEKTRRPRKAV